MNTTTLKSPSLPLFTALPHFHFIEAMKQDGIFIQVYGKKKERFTVY